MVLHWLNLILNTTQIKPIKIETSVIIERLERVHAVCIGNFQSHCATNDANSMRNKRADSLERYLMSTAHGNSFSVVASPPPIRPVAGMPHTALPGNFVSLICLNAASNCFRLQQISMSPSIWLLLALLQIFLFSHICLRSEPNLDLFHLRHTGSHALNFAQ